MKKIAQGLALIAAALAVTSAAAQTADVSNSASTSAASSDKKKAPPIILSTELAPKGVSDKDLIARDEIPYSNIWADDKGHTHISKCVLTGLKLHGFAPPAAPYYMGIAPENIKSIVYSVIPVGWYGDWHHAPGPQWVIDLSGEWEVKATDGTTLRQGPGQFQFNSDESSFAEKAGDHVGHTARQVGKVPDVRVIITLKKTPGKSYDNQPCVM